jgi:hypothetical protein
MKLYLVRPCIASDWRIHICIVCHLYPPSGAIMRTCRQHSHLLHQQPVVFLLLSHHAEAVRRDLKLLQSRTAVVSSRQVCVACNRCILDPPPNPLKLPYGGAVPPFYLFPTGQAFHVLCAAAEVVQYGGDMRAKEVRQQGQSCRRMVLQYGVVGLMPVAPGLLSRACRCGSVGELKCSSGC